MNSEDVENMTVAALKRELKSRNLPMVGNKAELAQRLMEHLANEERSILQTSGISDDVLDVPEEVVLGIAAPDFVEKKKTENIEPSALTSTTQTNKPISGGDVKSPILKPATSLISQPNQIVAAVSPISASPNAVAEIKPPAATPVGTMIGQNAQKPEKRKLTTISSLSENERKLMRAKKFNVPVTQTKEMRAERFGLKNSTVGKNDVKTAAPDENVAKKRAERFGIPLHKEKVAPNVSKQNQDETSKLDDRARRFGLNESQKDSAAAAADKNKTSDQILKRKQRFGGVETATAKDSGATAAKKMLRAQRFGLKY